MYPAMQGIMAIFGSAMAYPHCGALSFVISHHQSDFHRGLGWWRALMTAKHNLILRTAPPSTQTQINGKYVVTVSLAKSDTDLDIRVWGVSSRAMDDYTPEATAKLSKGGEITVSKNGHYLMEHTLPFTGKRGTRIFVSSALPPEFTLDNYHKVLFDPKNKIWGKHF